MWDDTTEPRKIQSQPSPGKEKQDKQNDFLEMNQPPMKPPISSQQDSGSGYGEDIKNLMNTMNQLLQIQNQQSQQMSLLMQRIQPTMQMQIPAIQNMSQLPPLYKMVVPNPLH